MRRSVALRLLWIVVVACAGIVTGTQVAGSVGSPLYPDLRTLAPEDLSFDVVRFGDGTSHHVLRLTNTIANVGPGRLELEGRPGGKVYQRFYDAPRGGTLVKRVLIGNDSVFHPGHNHYHFANFASYQLLQEDARGVYQPLTQRGTKTSFCVVDSIRVQGVRPQFYTRCDRAFQGLMVGWADVYDASLPDQWIDLGGARLADGAYAVRSTADPADKLDEGGHDDNNGARTCFTVRTGAITVVPC
jgi:hypothetical protein